MINQNKKKSFFYLKYKFLRLHRDKKPFLLKYDQDFVYDRYELNKNNDPELP